MKTIRTIAILSSNLFFSFLIIKALCIDVSSDTNGLFALAAIVMILFFNLYIITLSFMSKNLKPIFPNQFIEIIYTILTSIPFALILVLFLAW